MRERSGSIGAKIMLHLWKLLQLNFVLPLQQKR